MKHFRRAKRAARKINPFCQNHEKFTFVSQGLSEFIDPKTFSSAERFFYSYSWRSEKLIIDLKTLFRARGTSRTVCRKNETPKALGLPPKLMTFRVLAKQHHNVGTTFGDYNICKMKAFNGGVETHVPFRVLPILIIISPFPPFYPF